MSRLSRVDGARLPRRINGCLILVPLLLPIVYACGAADAGHVQDPIELALSAAPPEIGATATVTSATGEVLRRGTGAYTCIAVPDAPMCVDAIWAAWLEAYIADQEPRLTGLGVSYMLAGDAGSSNVDPRASGPTASNEWVVSGPHLMLIVPDASTLEALPTDPAQGGPYVMWKGTPYAHAMVPVPGRSRER